jgi:hypothetical protein
MNLPVPSVAQAIRHLDRHTGRDRGDARPFSTTTV